MKKSYIPFITLLMIFGISCNDQNTESIVKYRVSGASSEYHLTWVNQDGEKTTEIIQPTSAQDEWVKSFSATEGQIYFMAARYYNPANRISLSVLQNGKTLKQASSSYDTTRYVIVSGTLPYE